MGRLAATYLKYLGVSILFFVLLVAIYLPAQPRNEFVPDEQTRALLEENIGTPVTAVQTNRATSESTVVVESNPHARIELYGVTSVSNITAIRIVASEELATPVAVVKGAVVRNATIRLPTQGPVAGIARCDDYDPLTGACSQWVGTDIPFKDYGSFIEFSVEHFTGYGGIPRWQRLFVTSNADGINANLAAAQDGTINEFAQVVADTTLYQMLNASAASTEARIIRTNDVISFNTYWVGGSRVDFAYATFKLYAGTNGGTLVCQSGNDNTGGVQIPDNGAGIRSGTCSPSSNFTVNAGDSFYYVVNLWANSIGGGGPASSRTATLQWDTTTANTWINISSIATLDINLTTNQSSYLQGSTVNASGYFFWFNGTPLNGRPVNVSFYNTTGGRVQSRNVTTTSAGFFNDTYAVPSSAAQGTWTVTVLGTYNGSINATNTTTFTVTDPPPAVSGLSVSPNPANNGTTVTVTATVTDGGGVSTVIAELIYPNATAWQNVTMNGPSPYTGTFTAPTTPTGSYMVRIWANDTSNGVNNSLNTSFSPYINITQYALITVDGSFSDWASVYNVTDTDDAFTGGDVQNWTNRSAATPPSARSGHAMVFDEQLNKTLLFGGSISSGTCDGSGDTYCNGTYAYNATDNKWYNLQAQTPPTARRATAIAFDHNLNRTIIFGGSTTIGACDGSGTPYCNGTYAYNATDNKWYNLQAQTPPTARLGAQMVFDRTINKTVLFGGSAASNCDGSVDTYCNGTYAYNATDNKWYNLQAQTPPTARESHAMAYDQTANRTVLFGGVNVDDCSVGCGDTHVYNATDNKWYNMQPSNAPLARSNSAAAYNPFTQGIIIFGGTHSTLDCDGNEGIYCNGTYAYNLADNVWNQIHAADAPSARISAIVFDKQDNTTLMFGGSSENCTGDGANCHETWALNYSSVEGGEELDILSVSAAHSSTLFYARVLLGGAKSATKYYRVFLVSGPASNTTSPSGGTVPFAYDRYIQVLGSACTVRNSTGQQVATCTIADSTQEMEINATLASLGITGDLYANVTVESASASQSYDFAPDTYSFVHYTAPILNLTLATDEAWYFPGQAVNASGTLAWMNGTPAAGANVTVTFTNGSTTQTRNVTTNSSGNYSDIFLVPGDANYTSWTVSATGWYNTTYFTSTQQSFTSNSTAIYHVSNRSGSMTLATGKVSTLSRNDSEAVGTWRYFNVSKVVPVKRAIPANSEINFSTTWAYDAAQAGWVALTWRLYHNNEIICQFGDDSYGGSTTQSEICVNESQIIFEAGDTVGYQLSIFNEISDPVHVDFDNMSATYVLFPTSNTDAPEINSVAYANNTDNSVNITWTTSETANASVRYGTTTALTTGSNGTTALVTNQNVRLYGLASGTLHYYNVTSCDGSGNCNTTGPHNFTSPARTVCVSETFSCWGTIQEAINASINGQTVVITAGATYNESVNVTRNITVTSNSTSYPTVYQLNAPAVTVNATAVTLKKLVINTSGTAAYSIGGVAFNLTDSAVWLDSSTGGNAVDTEAGVNAYVILERVNVTAVNGGSATMDSFIINNSRIIGAIKANFGTQPDNKIINTYLENINATNWFTTFTNATLNGSLTGIWDNTFIDSYVNNGMLELPPAFSITNTTFTNASIATTLSTVPYNAISGTISNVTIFSPNATSLYIAELSAVTKSVSITVVNSTLQPIYTTLFNITDGSDSINVTYQSYLDGTVVNSSGAGVPGAEVNLTDAASRQVFSLVAGAGGTIARQTVTYANTTNVGAAQQDTYYTLHDITAFNTTYGSASQTLNLTTSQSVTLTIAFDTTPPEIMNAYANMSATRVNITWTTDEEANSSVRYGTTEALSGGSNNSASLTMAHQRWIYGLTPGTLYYYNLTSCDTLGNCNTTGPHNFTTTSYVNLSACQELDEVGVTYRLTQSLVYSLGECMSMTGSDSTFDGQGYTLESDAGSDYGVHAWAGNVTVKNTVFDGFQHGVYVDAPNVLIVNNTVTANACIYAASINNADNGTVLNNTFFCGMYSGSGQGMVIEGNTVVGEVRYDSDYGRVSNNNIENTPTAINIGSGDNSTIENNRINNVSIAVYLALLPVQGLNFTNNTITNFDSYAFFVESPTNTRISNTTITNSTGRAFEIRTSLGPAEIKIQNTSISNVTEHLYTEAYPVLHLIDTAIGEYNITNSTNLTVETSAYGIINFTQPVNGSGTNFSSDIRIQQSNASVDSLNQPGFNRSANVTLYNIPVLANPRIMRDDEICPASVCYNFTALEGTVLFNVSGWTDFTIQAASTITAVAPANGTIVDRDETQADPDVIILNVSTTLNNGRTVTFKANLTSPPIGGQTDITLGTNTTSNGYAVLYFNPLSNTHYAGNYTWWAENPSADTLNSMNFVVQGTYTQTYSASLHPNSTYFQNDSARTQVNLTSSGLETRSQLNSTYGAVVNAQFTNTSGSTGVVGLVFNGSLWNESYALLTLRGVGEWNNTVISSVDWFYTPANIQRSFIVYGYMNITANSTTPSTIYSAEYVTSMCRVQDQHTQYAVQGANITFYRDGAFVGSNLTNSSGHTEVSYQTNSTGAYTITCNITSQPSIYYYAGGEAQHNNTLSVVSNPPVFSGGVNDSSNTTSPTNEGFNVTFTANATDVEGDNWRLVVCDSEAIAGGACVAGQFCASGYVTNGSLASCQYNTSGNALEEYEWWAYACDTGNQCSAYNNDTSPFNVNHAPGVTSVTISPTSPNATSTLTCNPSVTDPDNGDTASAAYAWYLRNEGSGVYALISGQTASTLASSHFDSNDQVACAVTATDNHGFAGNTTNGTTTISKGNLTASSDLAAAQVQRTASTTINVSCGVSNGDGESVSVIVQDNRTGTYTQSNTSVDAVYVNMSGTSVGRLAFENSSNHTIIIYTQVAGNYSFRALCSASDTDPASAASTPQTLEIIADTTTPVISDVFEDNIELNTAGIVWNTDDSSDSVVEYGPAPNNLNGSVLNPGLVTSHNVVLVNLAPDTTYYYNVTSCNADNYCSTSGPYNFTTLGAASPGTPFEDGYCTAVVVEPGPNYREGYINKGDVVEFYCEMPHSIQEREDVTLTFTNKNKQIQKILESPGIISGQRVVLYP